MKEKVSILFLLITCFSVTCNAATTMDFLNFSIGGKAVAMGEAFVGLADDTSSIFWNPAGLPSIKNMQFMVMHNIWLMDSMYDFAGGVIRLGKGTLGIAGYYYSLPDIEIVNNNGEVIDTAKINDIAGSLSYAMTINPKLNIGANVKFVQSTIYTKSATGFAADVGGIYKISDTMALGIVARNLGPTVTYDVLPQNLPMTIIAGGLIKLAFGNSKISVTADYVSPIEGNSEVNIGADYPLNAMSSVRAGYHLGKEKRTYSLGLGLNIGTLSIDYAFVPYENITSTHRISLSYKMVK